MPAGLQAYRRALMCQVPWVWSGHGVQGRSDTVPRRWCHPAASTIGRPGPEEPLPCGELKGRVGPSIGLPPGSCMERGGSWDPGLGPISFRHRGSHQAEALERHPATLLTRGADALPGPFCFTGVHSLHCLDGCSTRCSPWPPGGLHRRTLGLEGTAARLMALRPSRHTAWPTAPATHLQGGSVPAGRPARGL